MEQLTTGRISLRRTGTYAGAPVAGFVTALHNKETLIAIAGLVRRRAALEDRADLMAGKDGMARFGAKRALDQLAVDLEIMADHVDRGEDDEDEDTA